MLYHIVQSSFYVISYIILYNSVLLYIVHILFYILFTLLRSYNLVIFT